MRQTKPTYTCKYGRDYTDCESLRQGDCEYGNRLFRPITNPFFLTINSENSLKDN